MVQLIHQRTQVVRRSWNGLLVAAKMIQKLLDGFAICLPLLESLMAKEHWLIFNDSIIVHLRAKINFVAFHPAQVAAILPVTIASPDIQCMLLGVLAVMATTRALAVFHRRQPWVTRDSIGRPPSSMAYRRSTKSFSVASITFSYFFNVTCG